MIDEKKFMEFITALEDAGAEYVSFDDLRKFVDEFPKIGGMREIQSGGLGMENRDNVKEKENSATDVLGALVKQLKTMWIVIVLLIVLLVGTNMAWLYVFQSYDYVSQDGEGQNYYNHEVGGDVFNGAEGKSEEERKIEGN